MYGRRGVIVFVFFLGSLACSGASWFDDGCGGEPYDQETDICCGGVTHPKDPNSECCGDRIIDIRASSCRLGVLVLHDHETGCDGVYYNKEEQLCCDGKLTERDPNIDCCYGQLMDTRASACVWAMVVNKDENGCDNIYYKRDEQVCCSDKLYPNTKYTECCDGQIMDTRAAVCILGMVIDTRNGCDGQFLDVETEFCCNHEIHTKDNTGCCDDEIYDTSTHTCDESTGVTVPKETPE